MCNKCKELVACPVGQKRIVEVDKPDKPEIVDIYGLKHHIYPTKIVIDKWPNGDVDCFIGQQVEDENHVQRGFYMDITNCPFCGERLK